MLVMEIRSLSRHVEGSEDGVVRHSTRESEFLGLFSHLSKVYEKKKKKKAEGRFRFPVICRQKDRKCQ